MTKQQCLVTKQGVWWPNTLFGDQTPNVFGDQTAPCLDTKHPHNTWGQRSNSKVFQDFQSSIQKICKIYTCGPP